MPFSLVDVVGAVGAVLTTICWLPQTVRILRTRDTHAISLPATIALTTGTGCWLIYGLALGDAPLIGANAISFALTLAILGLKLRHG
jgi:MtN3 and saliva related transmembrane protein